MKKGKTICVVCQKNLVVESRVVHPFEGGVPDQNNCDLNKYSDYKIWGGLLLKNRSKTTWRSQAEKQNPLQGGICNACLKHNETVKSLVPYIDFAKKV